MKCNFCGGKMSQTLKNHELVYECVNCGMKLATTIVNEIDADITIYELSILNKNIINDKKIRVIKTIYGCFSVEAIDILKNGRFLIKGYAWQLIDYKKMLDENNIYYKINPEFRY